MRLPLALALATALAGSARAVDVAVCGQPVSDFQAGVLQVDLDCPDAPGICVNVGGLGQDVPCDSDADCAPNGRCARTAVQLRAGASLQLNGHTLSGAGILCSPSGTCSVSGPGSIVGAGAGILARRRVIASQLTIDGGGYGIVTRRGGAILTAVTLTNNGLDGIWSWRGTIRATDVVASGNGGDGIYATLRPVIFRNVTASNNGGSGIAGSPPRGSGATAQGNVGAGIISDKGLTANDSTVTGNGLVHGGLDLYSARRPRATNTTCDHSLNAGPLETPGRNWAVCASD